jgi:uncharacterized protein
MHRSRLDESTEKAVRRFLASIAGRFDVERAIVYGSRARGTHETDSDADVAVVLRGDRQNTLDAALEMSDAAYDVLLQTGINISPLPVWADDWEHPERHANPALLRNIARDGVSM